MRFDLGGAVSLIAGLTLLLLASSASQSWGLARPQTAGTALAGAVCLAVFVWLQRNRPAPLLDLGLFRSRIFTGSVLSAMLNYVALFTAVLLMPFYLEEGLGLPPTRVGLVLTAQPLAMALTALPSGWLSDRIGTRWLATGGMIVVAIGLAGMATLGPDQPIWMAVVWLLLVGIGTGVFISPNSSALMGSAPRARQGTAGSVMGEARMIGMLLGVTLSTAVFQAAGGTTGSSWGPADFHAFSLALLSGVVASIAAAVASAVRGGGANPKPV